MDEILAAIREAFTENETIDRNRLSRVNNGLYIAAALAASVLVVAAAAFVVLNS
jgi:hypothetical protein